MRFIIDFLHQEVPKSGKGMPAYYRKALLISETMLAAYFVASVVLLGLTTDSWPLFPIGILFVTVVCRMNLDNMSARVNLAAFSLLVAAWLTWFVTMFGWAAGSPNILVPILSLTFFNIYERPAGKILYFLCLVAFRITLFAFSMHHTPVGALTPTANLTFQIINSVLPLLTLAINYILFSSSVQASERQLTIHNQELHVEAGTDPLTGLPNRRVLLDTIEAYRKENPSEPFGIAIADIDFFKKVNDTYGHHCGDYTLKELSRLFLESAKDRYHVCRWGGEEFCFFMPGTNLDTAGRQMQDLNIAVKKMPLHFGDVDFSITITIGVEEYDFQSPTEAILDKADRKLYMGKVGGRDRVVI